MSQEILQSILQLRSRFESQPFDVLNLAPGLPPVTLQTPVAEARRNYMRLAAVVHPDKFTGKAALVADATEAFQILVKVFEKVANPSFRQTAAAKPTKSAQPKKEGPSVPAAAKKPPAAKKASKRGRSSSDEDESETDSEQETALDATRPKSASKTSPPTVLATKPKPSRAGKELITRDGRVTAVGTKCTVVQCPRCVTTWEPDERRHYSLFMGYGLKVHCQLCLFVFGCATAVHRCPYCPKTFDFDVSMYDESITCGGCKKTFGFPYFPVTEDMVENIRASEREEESKRRQQDERAERAAARSRSAADADDDKLLELIGRCAVEEQCPICQKSRSEERR